MAQELILREISLRREPSEFVFPPLLGTKDIQQQMPKGQLVLSFLSTSNELAAFALTRSKCTAWAVEKPAEVEQQITLLLRQLGLGERDLTVSPAVLQDASWKTTAARLLTQLTKGLPPDTWDTCQELVVVPDGILWYVPFEALLVGEGEHAKPLISKFRVRYVPTVALANAQTVGHKPNARTAVVAGKLPPNSDRQAWATACDELQRVLPQASRLGDLPAAPALFAVTCDRLVVLSDLGANPRGPYSWSPLPTARGKAASTLEDWLALPWQAPAEIILPGFHTPAETGLKTGGSGDELFLAACGLMASGARSILISRWPSAGHASVQLTREYVQELPYASAATAWQRSVQLLRGGALEPDAEPRVAKGDWKGPVTGDHPLFWAGHLLIDIGSIPQP